VSITIGFSIPREDEQRLQRLVARFGQGNRSAFLRAAMRHMEVLDRAERLDDLSEYGAERLAASGLSPDQIPDLVKQVLSTPTKK
jgi:Arc/MetJ-type ribon-helix-helix transcriptional regulator